MSALRIFNPYASQPSPGLNHRTKFSPRGIGPTFRDYPLRRRLVSGKWMAQNGRDRLTGKRVWVHPVEVLDDTKGIEVMKKTFSQRIKPCAIAVAIVHHSHEINLVQVT